MHHLPKTIFEQPILLSQFEENNIDEFIPRKERAATITSRMTLTANKLMQQMIESQSENAEYCPICYTNEI